MGEHEQALAHALELILWKLTRNEWSDEYRGPARITRQDATVKHASRIMDEYLIDHPAG